MTCQFFRDDKGNVEAIICNIDGHHVKEGKLYLDVLELELKVIGEPKKAWDSGDCGQWEIPVECPKCGQPAMAMEGFAFAFDLQSVKCNHCGYFFDSHTKKHQDRLNNIKAVFKLWFEKDITDEQAEQFEELSNKVHRWMMKHEYYLYTHDDLLAAFGLLARHYNRIRREIKRHVNRNKRRENG